MTYHQFVNEVEMKVKNCVAENITVSLHVAVKNNGCERRGLMMTESGINISPTIYLEDYYEWFQSGETLEEIVRQVVQRYEEVRFHKSWEGDSLRAYDKIKERIVYKLINREKNRDLLKCVPYKAFLDLAVVCDVLLELDSGQMATMLIKNEHLKMWNIEEEEVFEQARKNVITLLPAKLSRMKDVLACVLGIRMDEEENDEFMYVLSNEERTFGAASLYYEGVLEMIREAIGEDFYVIPSSVHEVILIRESMAPDRESIIKMIAEVNETQLEDEEILSDKVYFYSKETGKLAA